MDSIDEKARKFWSKVSVWTVYKLSEEDVEGIDSLIEQEVPLNIIANIYNVNAVTIRRVLERRYYFSKFK